MKDSTSTGVTPPTDGRIDWGKRVQEWVRGSDRDSSDDPEFVGLLYEFEAGKCHQCGGRGYLDGLNCCSGMCDERAISKYEAEGHNHGPDDPPTDDDGRINWNTCPACVLLFAAPKE